MKYEFKYIVPVNLMEQLREAISPYVELDPYAAEREDHQYTVRSVYFDTSRFDYYFEKIDGYRIRKKIRIRGYNVPNGDEGLVFLEIKRKYKEPVVKNREMLSYDVMLKLMAGDANKILNKDGTTHDINGAGKFLYHVYRQNLKPVILVIYEREAFHDRFKNDVRITMDKNLRSVAYPCLSDLYDEGKAIPANKGNFILEVKFKDHFPGWLRPITGRFGLIKRSVSKYVFCIDSHHLTEPSRKADMFRLMHWNSL
jgi:hypothetical protein